MSWDPAQYLLTRTDHLEERVQDLDNRLREIEYQNRVQWEQVKRWAAPIGAIFLIILANADRQTVAEMVLMALTNR